MIVFVGDVLKSCLFYAVALILTLVVMTVIVKSKSNR